MKTLTMKRIKLKDNSLSWRLQLRPDLAELLTDILFRLDLRLQVVLQLKQCHFVKLLTPPVFPVFLWWRVPCQTACDLHHLHLFSQLTSKGLLQKYRINLRFWSNFFFIHDSSYCRCLTCRYPLASFSSLTHWMISEIWFSHCATVSFLPYRCQNEILTKSNNNFCLHSWHFHTFICKTKSIVSNCPFQ